MRNLPVHWSEGLFLRPHHFQAADRYWTETVSTADHWNQQYFYGVRQFELSAEAAANYQLQVNVCHARMRDGTLVVLDAGQALDRVDLKEAFAKEGTVRVFLGVPKLALGVANVVGNAGGGKHRYVESKLAVQDESLGGNDQDVEFRLLNVRLLLSTQDLEGYELLPVAQLQRVGEREAAPQLDANYVPPLLAIDAWPPLGRDIIRAVYDLIGKKIEVLSQQVIGRGITLVAQEPGDLDRLWMLSQLNSAYTTLDVLTFAQGVHPFAAYTELARVVGQLSIFSPARRPPEIPHYDHDDLGRIFRELKKHIEALLEAIRPYEYEQEFFVGVGKGMRATLKPKWLNADWRWFIGVRRSNLTREQCMALLSPGQLDWKLGSERQVDALFKFRAEGLHLTPLEQAPRALPPNPDWIYYEVSRDNAPWNDVVAHQTLAMRLKENLIANLENLQGKRQLVVAIGGKQFPLEFALFAVPVRA